MESDSDSLCRCGWALSEPCRTYHDVEWGVPVRNDVMLFEMLTLEGAQAGLSWETVLKKREGYRTAFKGFDLVAVSQFTDAEAESLMSNVGIIRNRAKILSTINNAKQILELQAQGSSLCEFVWSFVDGNTIHNEWQTSNELPAQTDLSKQMSKALLKRGFRFVGPTICYSFMQAVGLVNDHTVECFRYKAIRAE